MNKYQSVTHVSTCFFQKKVFRSEALVTKKLRAILDYFHRPDSFVPYPINKKNIFNKNSLNYCSLKVTKFHGDSVKNESAV